MPRAQKSRVSKAKKESQAIMRIAAPVARPWQLSEEEITLVKNHIAKGATDSELQFCLTVARRYKLDPFRGQIWFVKRNDRSAEGGARWIPIVGINGLRHIAARDHADFGAIEEPEFGPLIEIKWEHYEKKGTIKAPEWARVRAWKKGFEHPIVATVYFEEIYPNVGASPMVRQMSRHMLAKCAEAHVIRKAWPGTDGLYIREEFQGPPDYTDSGRRITYPEQPSGAPPLDESAAHGHEPGSRKAEIASNSLKAVEEADAAFKAEREAIVTEGRTVEEPIWPAKESGRKEPPASKRTAEGATKQRSAPSAEPHIAEGTITHSVAGMAGKIPVRDVTMCIHKAGEKKVSNPSFRCFDRKLFKFLDEGLGKEAALLMKQNGKFWNIVGLVRIGAQHFEDDGFTPCISVDREPGMLFGGGK